MQFEEIASQRVQTYQIDRQTSEKRISKKCAAGGYFTKVTSCFANTRPRPENTVVKTPPVNTKVIATLPVFLSVCAAALMIRHFNLAHEAIPLVLGIIAGALVDLDNRLTGRLKNIFFTILAFTVSSLTVQLTIGRPLLFSAAMTLLAFIFTISGAIGLRYRTIAFGTIAVSIYTTLTYHADTPWYTNPLMILAGTSMYSGLAVLSHIVFPHRPVQENVANAYLALADYLDAKARFFDPDEAAHIEQQQINLAMKNSQVITAFNLCRSALFYRMSGQHRHPQTSRMLRYYFAAQDIHERASSSHIQYQEMVEKLKHSDLIYRFQRLLELQGQACRDIAAGLRHNNRYLYDERLARASQGLKQSIRYYADHHAEADELHSLKQLATNLRSVNHQLNHLESGLDNEQDSEATRIAHNETSGLRNVLHALRGQLNFESATFRHAVRMAILTLTCCTLVETLNLQLGYWIWLTALFVCQPNYSATQKKLKQRIIGTILGVLVGSLLPYFTPSLETKLIIVVLSTTLFYFFRTNKYSYSTFFITIQALTNFSIAGMDTAAALPLRIIDTIIGAGLAWVAVSQLWPDWHYLALDKTGLKAIRSEAGYLRSILQQLQNGSIDDVDYRIARRQAHESAAALSSTLSDMSMEPAKYGDKLQSGFQLLKLNYSLLGYISALGAYRSQMHNTPTDPALLSAFFQTAYQLADLLSGIGSLKNSDFRQQLAHVQQTLEELHTPDQTHSEQASILWQQLSMIADLLPACRESIEYTTLTQAV